MKKNWNDVEQWLLARNSREGALIFLAGFAIVYLLWNVVMSAPLHKKRENLATQEKLLLAEVDTKRQMLNTIEAIITSSAFIKEMSMQKQLNNKSQQANKQIKTIEYNLLPAEWLTRVTNDIIAQQDQVTLISLKTFSEEPWQPSQAPQVGTIAFQQVQKHKMQIEFRGSYFNTIEFLAHLEKLPWHIYWDSLDYKVLTYPEADVVAQFYVLSN